MDSKIDYVVSINVYARVEGDPRPLMSLLRDQVRRIDANLVVSDMRTLDDQLNLRLSNERLLSFLSNPAELGFRCDDVGLQVLMLLRLLSQILDGLGDGIAVARYGRALSFGIGAGNIAEHRSPRRWRTISPAHQRRVRTPLEHAN